MRKIILIRASVFLCAAAFIAAGTVLHHGWANYDADKEMDYNGIIQSNDIGNPHTYIDIEVIGEEEIEIKEWKVVLAPVTRMRNRGMTDDSMLAVGDTVRVVGYPHRNIENEMRAERIIIGDVTIELR
ncbi:DUF6152 family protein [Rhodohalobacter sp. SW132]|uniref:DUF6152 family protein n=1 Tax=Rhodohalobacter sp. SW132 TaxID=2293433 RepID=UPI0018F77DAE|nr:DUF6152 family protein [Rhodohalobacter sp. SW132]